MSMPKVILPVLFRAMATMFCVALALCWQGCETFDSYTPVYQISLHQFPGKEIFDSRLARVVNDPQTGIRRQIKTISFLDSSRISSGKVLDEQADGKCGISLELDRFGVHTLLHLSGSMPGDHFAIIIDGFYAGTGTFPPHRINGENTLELHPLWSRKEAWKIVRQITKNYEHYNHK